MAVMGGMILLIHAATTHDFGWMHGHHGVENGLNEPVSPNVVYGHGGRIYHRDRANNPVNVNLQTNEMATSAAVRVRRDTAGVAIDTVKGVYKATKTTVKASWGIFNWLRDLIYDLSETYCGTRVSMFPGPGTMGSSSTKCLNSPGWTDEDKEDFKDEMHDEKEVLKTEVEDLEEIKAEAREMKRDAKNHLLRAFGLHHLVDNKTTTVDNRTGQVVYVHHYEVTKKVDVTDVLWDFFTNDASSVEPPFYKLLKAIDNFIIELGLKAIRLFIPHYGEERIIVYKRFKRDNNGPTGQPTIIHKEEFHVVDRS